jgi:hypothetical protein
LTTEDTENTEEEDEVGLNTQTSILLILKTDFKQDDRIEAARKRLPKTTQVVGAVNQFKELTGIFRRGILKKH